MTSSNIIFKKFADIHQFNQYLKNGKTIEGWGEPHSQFEDRRFLLFSKTHNYNEANDLLLYGDKNLQKQIEAAGVAETRINIQKQVAKRQIFCSVVGCAPHIPNFIAGVPTQMINERKIKVRQRVLNIFYNMSVGHKTKANEIIKACANFISACMKIEASGVHLNIFASSFSEFGSQKAGFCFKVKDAGQPFDTLRMAYPLAHPSMNRRHKFRFLEVTEGVNPSWSWNYGVRCNSYQSKMAFKDLNLNPDCVLDFYDIEYYSADEIAKIITGRSGR